MKKTLALIAALAVFASASFAQINAKRMTEKDYANMTPAAMFKANTHKTVMPVATTSAPKNVTSFPWTEDFETGTTPTGFTFVDSDNDGNNWDPTYLYGQGYGHNGSNGMIASASYDNNSGALTPDNWMILPAFNIPSSAADYELTWYEKGQDANYAAEYYSVYINTTGASVANFTATTAVLTSTATGSWVKKTVSLANYAGQTIYIAFRHHNITDMFYLDIDDMRVGGPSAPEITVTGPAIVLMNQPATFTANTSVSSVNWYVDGNQESSTALTLTYTFTTDGLHEVVAEVMNSVGSAFDTLNVNVVDCGTGISTFPYTEGFEAENPCWQFVSADPANDDRVGITSDDYHGGSSSYVLSSYSSADDYNQFLITPEITLTAGTDYMVSFWYKGYNASDAFRVKVSSTTSDTAAFTTVLADYPTVSTDWTYVALSLPANTKYIAFNYYGDFAYYLYIDDLTIDEMGVPSASVFGPTTIGTGIEGIYVATTNLATSIAWYVDGTEITGSTSDTLAYTFTTATMHEVVVEATNNYGSAYDTLMVDVFSCDDISIPYTPDFTAGLGCWSNRCDLEEGLGWYASVDMFESDPEGQILSMSAQSIWGMFMIDVDVDNWLISPAITMPASGSYEIAWSVKPYTTDYAGDHYGVYAIYNGDTTLLFEETLNSSMTDYVDRTAAVPSTINGDFQVAFRHWNSAGGYVIIIDDIQLRELTAPMVSIEGPTFAPVNTEVTFTANSGTADSYSWTVDGTAVSETGATLHHTFNAVGNYTVTVTGTNNAGTSAPASINVTVAACDITSLPYNQGFEDATYTCWTLLDGFEVYNDPDYADYAHAGNGFLLGNYDDYADVDQWAISPAITMPANATGIVFGYYVHMTEYGGIENEYEVRVSTTGNSPANFTTVIKHETGSTDDYEYRGASLENFAGQTIYIALHNITAAGGDAIFFDDLLIGQGTVTGIENAADINVNVFPNPATDILNIEGEGIQKVEVIDINGRTVITTNETSLNISALASGVYMVRVIAAEGIHTERVVKK